MCMWTRAGGKYLDRFEWSRYGSYVLFLMLHPYFPTFPIWSSCMAANNGHKTIVFVAPSERRRVASFVSAFKPSI